jgi:hypothetical protein
MDAERQKNTREIHQALLLYMKGFFFFFSFADLAKKKKDLHLPLGGYAHA